MKRQGIYNYLHFENRLFSVSLPWFNKFKDVLPQDPWNMEMFRLHNYHILQQHLLMSR